MLFVGYTGSMWTENLHNIKINIIFSISEDALPQGVRNLGVCSLTSAITEGMLTVELQSMLQYLS